MRRIRLDRIKKYGVQIVCIIIVSLIFGFAIRTIVSDIRFEFESEKAFAEHTNVIEKMADEYATQRFALLYLLEKTREKGFYITNKSGYCVMMFFKEGFFPESFFFTALKYDPVRAKAYKAYFVTVYLQGIPGMNKTYSFDKIMSLTKGNLYGVGKMKAERFLVIPDFYTKAEIKELIDEYVAKELN